MRAIGTIWRGILNALRSTRCEARLFRGHENAAYWRRIYEERDQLRARGRPDLTGRDVRCGKCGSVTCIVSGDDVTEYGRRFDTEFYVICAGCEERVLVMTSEWVPPPPNDRNGNINWECGGSYTRYELSDAFVS